MTLSRLAYGPIDYRAESARVLDQADKMTDRQVRSALIEIAQHYARLADQAQERRQREIGKAAAARWAE